MSFFESDRYKNYYKPIYALPDSIKYINELHGYIGFTNNCCKVLQVKKNDEKISKFISENDSIFERTIDLNLRVANEIASSLGISADDVIVYLICVFKHDFTPMFTSDIYINEPCKYCRMIESISENFYRLTGILEDCK